MDPKACLDRVRDLLADRDFEEAFYALEDYRAWRASGGFAPERGDERAQRYQHACNLKGFWADTV